MLYAAGLLHAKIAAVCPIDGVCISDPTNASTWSFQPSSATPPTAAQLQAAETLLAAITPAQLAAADASVVSAVAAVVNPVVAAQASAASTALGTLGAVTSGINLVS